MNKIISWILCIFLLTIHINVYADNLIPENQQKAKIIKYLFATLEWPKKAIKNNQLYLCLYGIEDSKPFEELDGAQVKQYKIKVSKSSNYNPNAGACHILYISKNNASSLDQLKKLWTGKPTILLSDTDLFALHGGSMNFVLIDHKVAITVNLDALKASQIQFDLKAYNQITVTPTTKDLNE